MKEVSFRNDILPLKDILYRLALRITLNRAEAEDIVQDTLIKVWNRRDDWAQMDNIEAYSMTVCRNLALDRIDRADNRTASLDDNGTERPDTASSPLERTAQLDRIEIVRSLIDSLPEKQRSCIQLRDFEGRTYKEIARLLVEEQRAILAQVFGHVCLAEEGAEYLLFLEGGLAAPVAFQKLVDVFIIHSCRIAEI